MTDKQQPEALRLAAKVEKCDRCGGTKPAAAMLRRQHTAIQELREALREIHQYAEGFKLTGMAGEFFTAWDAKARAALVNTEDA